MQTSKSKYILLQQALAKYSRVAVAFSGGVDSTLLYFAACAALGKKNVFVFHGLSVLISEQEHQTAVALLAELDVPRDKRVVIPFKPLSEPGFAANTKERCYICKKMLYRTFLSESLSKECDALLDGTNADDSSAERPGFRAIRELGVQTPLLDVHLGKKEIRSLACHFYLSNHDKPSNSCLATRIPEGTIIGKDTLRFVENYEDFLQGVGVTGCRVRIEGKDAVLQMPQQSGQQLLSSVNMAELLRFVQLDGFTRVLLDLNWRD
jgi:uncharacterized protein